MSFIFPRKFVLAYVVLLHAVAKITTKSCFFFCLFIAQRVDKSRLGIFHEVKSNYNNNVIFNFPFFSFFYFKNMFFFLVRLQRMHCLRPATFSMFVSCFKYINRYFKCYWFEIDVFKKFSLRHLISIINCAALKLRQRFFFSIFFFSLSSYHTIINRLRSFIVRCLGAGVELSCIDVCKLRRVAAQRSTSSKHG